MLEPSERHPIYVAANLAKIPPISTSNVDLLQLISDIQEVKSVVLMLTTNQRNLTESVSVVSSNNVHTAPIHSEI